MTESSTPAPVRRRSLGKLLVKIVAALVILVVVGLGVLYMMRNSLVRAGVIRGGEYATDQKTGLTAADLSFGSHSLLLSQLDIANIDNANKFREPKLLVMKECLVDVDTWSLLGTEATVNEIRITVLEITIETNLNLKNNLADLMEILKKKSPATNAPPGTPGGGNAGSAPAESPGKKLRIAKLKLDGTKVHLRGLVSHDLDLGPIEMLEPTNPDGRPMKIADVVAKVLLHVAQQIINDPKITALDPRIKDSMKNVQALVDTLGKDLQKDLRKNLGDVTKIGQDAQKAIQDLGKNLSDPSKDAGKSIQDAQKGLQDAGKSLQGLIPGNKTTQPK
jgi:hypothetical protein